MNIKFLLIKIVIIITFVRKSNPVPDKTVTCVNQKTKQLK